MKKILILGGSREQLIAVNIAKEFGLKVAVFDGSEDAVCRKYSDEFYCFNIKDKDLLKENAIKCSPDGVLVHAAELAIEGALISNWLGLPGISVESARIATEKKSRLEKFKEFGILMPEHRSITGLAAYEEWLSVSDEIGFPFVVKPNSLAGARGVQLIENELQMRSYFADKDAFKSEHFIFEQYIEGEQLSTESILFEGEILHTAIAFRHYETTKLLRPYLIEDGHSFPYEISSSLKSKINEIVKLSAKALGIESGVLKGDLIVDHKDSVFTIEMAARTSGGRFADTVVPMASGVNILYPLIRMAMGMNLDLDELKPKAIRGISQRFIFPQSVKSQNTLLGLTRYLQSSDVLEYYIDPLLIQGYSERTIQCHGDRLGYIITGGKSREAADKLALAIVRGLESIHE